MGALPWNFLIFGITTDKYISHTVYWVWSTTSKFNFTRKLQSHKTSTCNVLRFYSTWEQNSKTRLKEGTSTTSPYRGFNHMTEDRRETRQIVRLTIANVTHLRNSSRGHFMTSPMWALSHTYQCATTELTLPANFLGTWTPSTYKCTWLLKQYDITSPGMEDSADVNWWRHQT